jgi:hypothetical protein
MPSPPGSPGSSCPLPLPLGQLACSRALIEPITAVPSLWAHLGSAIGWAPLALLRQPVAVGAARGRPRL